MQTNGIHLLILLKLTIKTVYMTKPGSGQFSVRTMLSPDISQLVKFARPVNSQLVDLLGRTFLS